MEARIRDFVDVQKQKNQKKKEVQLTVKNFHDEILILQTRPRIYKKANP